MAEAEVHCPQIDVHGSRRGSHSESLLSLAAMDQASYNFDQTTAMKGHSLTSVPMNSNAGRNITVNVDQASDQEWDAILTEFDDASIYQTSAYGIVRWGERNVSRLVISQDEVTLAAAQLRILRVPILGSGIAYLRWGPLCHRSGTEVDPEVVRNIIFALRDEYAIRRGLLLQILPNARRSTQYASAMRMACYDAGFLPDYTLPRYTSVFVDLARPLDAVRRGLAQKWRNCLNSSERNNLEVERSDGVPAYEEFVRLYRSMQERKRFESTVDVSEFSSIQELLRGAARLQTFVARSNGRAVGSIVCSTLGNTGIYLLGATDEEGRRLKAAYHLHWQAIRYLKDSGAQSYDLGGVDREANPGGYSFKTGFGGSEESYAQPQVCSRRPASAAVRLLVKARAAIRK